MSSSRRSQGPRFNTSGYFAGGSVMVFLASGGPEWWLGGLWVLIENAAIAGAGHP